MVTIATRLDHWIPSILRGHGRVADLRCTLRVGGRGAVLALALSAAASGAAATEAPTNRADLVSLARGTLPVSVVSEPAALAAAMDHALLAIDGDDRGFVATPKPGGADSRLTIVYALPARTTFGEFEIPGVLETPSPSQTFFREVEISGSDAGPEGPFVVLATTTLSAHAAKGEATAVAAVATQPVRWLRLVLRGGLDVRGDKTFFEFSELRGYGDQEPVALSTAFDGKWKGRGMVLELHQSGASVSGCYDKVGDLEGTVSGNVLRATGRTRSASIPSTFVLVAGAGGGIAGVRSTNGAPFRLYAGEPDPALVTECSKREVAPPGCGAVLHGIEFDYDSASIRPDSVALLDALARGLAGVDAGSIVVTGHTSSEGSDAYNDDLSRRRAEAVAAAMVSRGIDAARISGRGLGEREPIADNATEAGRSLNRRVEIECR